MVIEELRIFRNQVYFYIPLYNPLRHVCVEIIIFPWIDLLFSLSLSCFLSLTFYEVLSSRDSYLFLD